eukprot:6183924-Pleurochrysis_carterae.AAC.1
MEHLEQAKAAQAKTDAAQAEIAARAEEVRTKEAAAAAAEKHAEELRLSLRQAEEAMEAAQRSSDS